MVCCGIMWIGIVIVFCLYKKGKLSEILEGKEAKYFFLALIISNLIAMLWFGKQWSDEVLDGQIERNSYGNGEKVENYEVTIEGELENEPFSVEIGEQVYTHEETLKMFEDVMERLNEVVLGENDSFDRVEHDLKLVDELEGYPVLIQWEMNPYQVLDLDGSILEDYKVKEGTLVELRATLEYADETAVYMIPAMVFPEKKSEKEEWLKELTELVQAKEDKSKEKEFFDLPSELNGKKILWEKAQEPTGYYILVLGVFAAILIPLKKIQNEKEDKKKRQEQMMRDYPEIVSKFMLLLGTGMTLKAVWMKIVQAYEENRSYTGIRFAYEEMCFTAREMQGGIAEKEAYERFGRRCEILPYMKFGALLSQNLRKGSKGLTELLNFESIQAFEERKSYAKKLGEEASTKLMLPMFIMLAIVLVMVIVPAFLSMQI